MAKHGRIRVESHQDVVTDAKILYLPEGYGDDEEVEPVDISRVVQGVDVHLNVGEPARATLRTIFVEGSLEAELEEVIETRIAPRKWRRSRRAWWLAQRWLRQRIIRSLQPEAQLQLARGKWPGGES